MSEWIVHEIAPTVRVRVTRQIPILDPALEAEVERLWQAELAVRPQLFNGPVFSVDEFTPLAINGHWSEFRRSVAQMRRGEIFEFLGVRSLAVSGVLCCADGVVIGRRNRQAVYQAGRWQLPPAGSVDPGAGRDDGKVDVTHQLLEELEEELGLSSECVEDFLPLCVIEHPGSHVSDLGIAMRMRVSGSVAIAAHAASGNREYEELHVMPVDQVLALGPDLMPTVATFLSRLPQHLHMRGSGVAE